MCEYWGPLSFSHILLGVPSPSSLYYESYRYPIVWYKHRMVAWLPSKPVGIIVCMYVCRISHISVSVWYGSRSVEYHTKRRFRSSEYETAEYLLHTNSTGSSTENSKFQEKNHFIYVVCVWCGTIVYKYDTVTYENYLHLSTMHNMYGTTQ